MSHIKVSMKLFDKAGVVRTYLAGTPHRFLTNLRARLWERCVIKVSYGKQIDVFGKLLEFTNEGEFTGKNKAVQALEAFLKI